MNRTQTAEVSDDLCPIFTVKLEGGNQASVRAEDEPTARAWAKRSANSFGLSVKRVYEDHGGEDAEWTLGMGGCIHEA